jgi:hypothetical protein
MKIKMNTSSEKSDENSKLVLEERIKKINMNGYYLICSNFGI